ncbi:MAG: hypothetical protein ACI8QC_000130 [Planctomycetota bacterium]|jgi:hypothetical protein
MRLHALILSTALALPAVAQSFNIDVGQNLILWPTPSASYGAAAAQPGHWTAFNPSFSTAALEDLGGALTNVTLTTNVTSSVNTFPAVIASGDDQALMEDFQWSGGLGQVTSLHFEGLLPGEYQVYTYAADPASGTDNSAVSVLGSPDPVQSVSGPWTGSHQLGGSYALHTVTVSAGILDIELEGTNPFPNDRTVCNGIQLIHSDDSLGSNYCSPAVPNTTGAPGGIRADGSDQVSQNDFTLTAFDLPLNQFGYFIASQTQGFIQGPGGSQGNLCISGTLVRFTSLLQSSGASGDFQATLNLNAFPSTPPGAVQVGETWNFQCWYRDFIQGGGATSNFTDAVSVLFL